MTTCTHCQSAFEILDGDIKMLDELSPIIDGNKLSITPPTMCPDCRLQRRQSHVNHVNLYERKCDLSGAQIISNTHPSKPYKIYAQEDWYSDKWEPKDYGKEYDFTRPFFEQLKELVDTVPRPNLMTGYEFDENCEYTNYSGKNKDCYLIFDSDENRDCYYSYSLNHCVNCVGCFRSRKSELCYECIDCVQCYSSAYLQDCDNCAESMFLKNCTGCKNCLMCSNLKNKEYHVENKPVSKEEFEQFRAMLGSHSAVESARVRFDALKKEFPQKYMHGVQNEDIEGDYLVNCKSAYNCFDSEDLWDCRHVYQGFMPLKNCMDIHECGEGERLYECSVAGYEINSCCFCNHTLSSMSDLLYSSLCHHSTNLFGCIGMRRHHYCILNTQYSEAEYKELVPKIVDHMKSTGEWGEFFPTSMATFAYNETLAMDYFPLSKKEVLANGWEWFEDIEKKDQYMGPHIDIPDSIDDVSDDICGKILTCEESGKQYKVIPQELEFHKQLHVPLPRMSFFNRYRKHLAMRNKRALLDRSCDKCGIAIRSSYTADRPEKIYCEPCYQECLL